MSQLRHHPIRSLALLLALFSAFFCLLAHAGSNAPLTPEERRWLDKNQARIVLAVETGYAPFVFLDANGQPAGLAHDYLRLIETKIGTSFRQQQLPELKTIFEKVRAGEVHIVNAVTKTAEREKFLSFTAPFITVPNVILVRNDHPGELREGNLSGLTVSLVNNYAITEYLTGKPLGLLPDLVPDDLTALLNVSFGRSDAAVVDLATASYLISQKGITNLRIAGEAALSIQLSLATPLDQPVLHSILQKGLAAISAEEREHIKQRWIRVAGPNLLADWRFWLAIGGLLLFVFVVIAFIAIWNRTLRRQVEERTADLEKERALLEQRVQERTADLQHSKESLDDAQRIAHMGNWELDLQNNKLVWSDEIFRIFELDNTRFGATYEAFLAVIHPEDRDAVNGAYAHSLETREPYGITHRLLMSDGRIKHVHEHCETFYGPEGKALRSVGTVQDVTERVLAERELEQYHHHLEALVEERTADLSIARDAAEAANRAKSVFLANMSHELRTPLNAILGFAQIMERDKAIGETHSREITTINRSGRHLLSLINDVLEIARIEAGRTTVRNEAFDLDATLIAVEEMIRVRTDAKGLSFAVERHGELPPYVLGDAHHLRQVLINLLGNAVKYTDHGQIGLHLRPEGERILFEVSDTGSGIAREDQERIFHAFYQTEAGIAKGEGTGLGLTISREFVHLMGGEISVTSSPGEGSTFSFAIPLPPSSAPEGAARHGRVIGLEAGQPACRILVVEDDPVNRELLVMLMQNTGFQVREAENGQQGVAVFEEWHPHLIWMDMRMPVMDGIAATRAIRSLPGGLEVRIVAFTASAFKEDREKILAAGCDEVVTKPMEENKLFEVMVKLLGLRLRYDEVRLEEKAPAAIDLSGLPASLRLGLGEAARQLDLESCQALKMEIAIAHPELARQLDQLLAQYRFDLISASCK